MMQMAMGEKSPLGWLFGEQGLENVRKCVSFYFPSLSNNSSSGACTAGKKILIVNMEATKTSVPET